MLARSRRIYLKNGIQFETPLLVPGFSSMAMGQLLHETTDRKVELTPCSIVHTQIHTEFIPEVFLVSAYDIHHLLLTDSESFSHEFKSSRYSKPRFLFIDSGWYEKQKNSQGAVIVEGQALELPWDEAAYRDTIDALDRDIPAVVVGYDHPGAYPEQIAHAQDFSGDHPEFAFTILLKAPEDSRFHEFDGLSQKDASNLRAFDIIGVTEKELGESILERLVTLANFRKQLDAAEVDRPIHVFGGLDPLYTPLLFAAGGEIFDGLGWLRYAYIEGMSMHREAGAILKYSPDQALSRSMTLVQFDNLSELLRLADNLKVFFNTKGDWQVFNTKGDPAKGDRQVFQSIGDHLKHIHHILEASLEMNHGR